MKADARATPLGCDGSRDQKRREPSVGSCDLLEHDILGVPSDACASRRRAVAEAGETLGVRQLEKLVKRRARGNCLPGGQPIKRQPQRAHHLIGELACPESPLPSVGLSRIPMLKLAEPGMEASSNRHGHQHSTRAPRPQAR